MIVTCQRCDTQFKLEDALVPEAGVRVRCSRCKHAFFIERGGGESEEVDPIHRRVALAVERAEAATPDITQDLHETPDGPPGEENPPQPSAPEPSPSARRAFGDLDGGEAGDWEFNDTPETGAPSGTSAREGPGQRLDAARRAVDGLLGPEPAPGSSREAAGAAAGGPAAADGPAMEEPLIEEPDLDEPDLGPPDLDEARGVGAAESFADLGDDDLTDPGDFDPFEDPELARAPGGLSAQGSPIARQETPDVVAGEEDGELGPFDDWDFLGDEAERRTRAAVAPAPPASIPERAGAALLDEPELEIPLPEDEEDEAPHSERVARVGNALGWTCVACLLAVGLHSGVVARPEALPQTRSVSLADGMEAGAVSGRWIENAKVGPLFVVSGHLRADPGTTASHPLRVRLLDGKGRMLPSPIAAVGPELPTADLREGDPRSLRSQLEARAGDLVVRPLAARERRAFHALFAHVPSQAVAFRIEPDLETPVLAPPDPEPAPAFGPSGLGPTAAVGPSDLEPAAPFGPPDSEPTPSSSPAASLPRPRP